MLPAPLGAPRLLLGLAAAILSAAVAGAPKVGVCRNGRALRRLLERRESALAGHGNHALRRRQDHHLRLRECHGRLRRTRIEHPHSGARSRAATSNPISAYQVKLNGKPSAFWDSEGDDLANERIGLAGRWWLNKVEKATGTVVGGWNSNDAEYLTWKAQGFTDGVYDYVYEGYLLFAYLVTDENGQMARNVTLDSSFHVLWKTVQRAPGPNDSAPTAHTFVVNETSDWYASSQPDEVRSIYAEWEPTRALPGELALPAGAYAVRLFLTEESFHESAGSPPSGSWATVMAHDEVQFAIAAPVPALSTTRPGTADARDGLGREPKRSRGTRPTRSVCAPQKSDLGRLN